VITDQTRRFHAAWTRPRCTEVRKARSATVTIPAPRRADTWILPPGLDRLWPESVRREEDTPKDMATTDRNQSCKNKAHCCRPLQRKPRSDSGGAIDYRIVLTSLALLALVAVYACSIQRPPRVGSLGEDVYRQNCALCHGINGAGADGPSLIDRPRTAEEVEKIVREGRGRMPAFGNRLPESELTAVAEYVAGLSASR
jgi:cytochrome c5